MQSIVLASNNAKKVSELSHLLAPQRWELTAQGKLNILEAEETGQTFVENALIKARHASQQANMPAIADDSGLVVDALQGAPGIFSARYAGIEADDVDNNNKLLGALIGIPFEQRTAHFHCTLVFLRHASDPDPLICQGRWHGNILSSPQGDNGFGYDPLFWVERLQCSAAQLSPAQKGLISHRGIASQKLVSSLAATQNPV